jgi:hypothetical protein
MILSLLQKAMAKILELVTGIASILRMLGHLSDQLEDLNQSVQAVEQRLQAVETEILGQRLLLRQILEALIPSEALRLVFTATLEGHVLEDVTNMRLTDVQEVDLSIQPVDKKGNAAPVEGAPAWSSSMPDVVSLTVAEDGLSAKAVAVGPLGVAQILVEADADLGEGIKPISGTLDIEVVPSEAVGLSVVAGVPVDQP